jgi:hypothetical protein
MVLTPMSTYDGIPCLRFRTSAGALTAEDMLRDEGRSYRTKIVRTRKRGIEYVVMVLD